MAAQPGQSLESTYSGLSVDAMAVDPFDSDRVVTGAQVGLLSEATIIVVTDSGTTATQAWTRVNQPGRVNQIAFSPDVVDLALAAVYPGSGGPDAAILYSLDGGDSWTDVAGTETFQTMAMVRWWSAEPMDAEARTGAPSSRTMMGFVGSGRRLPGPA